MIYETDTNRVLVWDNAAWVMIADTDQPPGLQLVASGTLSLTTSATNVTGVFSSTYKNYRVLFNITARSTTNRIDTRYIAGTTPTSTAYYQGGVGGSYAADSVIYYQRSNNDGQFFGQSAFSGGYWVMDISMPNRASLTFHTGSFADGNSALAYQFGGEQISTTQFTGFQLFTSTGTATVEYQVFGYRD
jgi:hypothetical protein